MKMFLLVDALVYAMKEVPVILGFSWILDKESDLFSCGKDSLI